MLDVEIGERHDCGTPGCMSWKLTVGGKVLTERCEGGHYGHFDLGSEFNPWMVQLPDILSGKEVVIPFSDDPHEWRFQRSDDSVSVRIVWMFSTYEEESSLFGRKRTKTIWTEEMDEGTTTEADFVLGLEKLGSQLVDLYRRLGAGNRGDSGRLLVEEGLDVVHSTMLELGLRRNNRP